jgi:hypothetical protein
MEIHPLPFSTSTNKSSLRRLPYKSDELPNPSRARTPRHGPLRKHRLLLHSISVGTCFFWRHYSATAAYSCLLRICCLSIGCRFIVSRSLSSNGPTRYNIYQTKRYYIPEGCVKCEKNLLSICEVNMAAQFAQLSLASSWLTPRPWK